MKKILALTITTMFAFTMTAQASFWSETDKAINKANSTMNTVNKVNNNVKTVRNNSSKVYKQVVKNQAKAAAKTEAKNQAGKAIDKLFN